MANPEILVVGAGFGGLSAAAHLAQGGARVTVLERAERAGGKARRQVVGGRAMDAGPTVLTMPWVFEELFRAHGQDLHARVKLRRLETLARHAWSDGSRLDLHTDLQRSRDAVARMAGRREARSYVEYMRYCARQYEAIEGPFLLGDSPDPGSVLARAGMVGMAKLARVDFRRTMWNAICSFFDDPRLRQLFGRYATYYGCSPYEAPATLNLIAEVERRGVYAVEGGMSRLADALAGLAMDAGARIRNRSEVRRVLVEQGRAAGVELADGTRLAADAVVLNVEPDAVRAGLLGGEIADAIGPAAGASRSTSAITWCAVATVGGFDLAHHTVFFSDDYGREFGELTAGAVPGDPTIYVCAQDRADAAAPRGPERLFVLINAPPRGDDPTFEEERQPWTLRTFERLAALGLQVEIQDLVVTTPRDFARRFPGSGGALYGATTRGWRAAFQRPSARTRVPGVFLAGGGSHPGAGLPMVCLSGRNAAAHVLREFPSTPRSRTTGMAGGTSTGSATTVDTH